MPHTLSIVVRADIALDTITLEVSGCLTRDTAWPLEQQIRRARAVDPEAPVEVDLTNLSHADADALEYVRALAEALTDPAYVQRAHVTLVGGSVIDRCSLTTGVDGAPTPSS
ncbi:hypothetical protein [Brachybacterium hainanense]|uniref:STAS domain-containing protein n=1 Tax=Brachybacterium hainanense TaxID=1541174 RepID=A0ABV6RBH6_9MICO